RAMAAHASAINTSPADGRGIMAVAPPLPPAILAFSPPDAVTLPAALIHARRTRTTNRGVHPREARSGRPDRIDRRLAAQDASDVGRAFALQLFERLDGIERGVRGEDDVV